ncbi:MAG: adenosylhomocysteinase [Oscillospiraceae bacterium]|jgi:adenosylhomocysteinase|nr:adenosylhomocysteinase [Oscillospiraceae bacterium]
MSEIKDIALAPAGEQKIAWVRRNMPLLRGLEEAFRAAQPFAGLRVALSVHLEAKTAYLCRVLAAGGAAMWITGSNPLSTQDDVAAALVQGGLRVFGAHGAAAEDYARHTRAVLAPGPHIIIDDGGDLVAAMLTDFPQHIPGVIGGCEETTTGILRLRALERAGKLPFPMVRVNDADCKHLFDNRYGTGQSVFDGINRTTNLIVAGKTVVVAGYGWCGKGAAMRAKGLGARVVVTEIDPVKAIEAVMDGFAVAPMEQAAPLGDFFITVTGCRDVITPQHFLLMKEGALLANAGHFNVEIDVAGLEAMATEKQPQRDKIMGYHLPNGRWVHLLAEGRLVNLAAGDGHPAEIMDMSFAIQAMSARWLADHRGEYYAQKLLAVPEEIDKAVAARKLASLGCAIDTLTAAQTEYLYA